MADYHVLNTDNAGNSLRVVFHIAVPSSTNDAGKTYQTALIEWSAGGDGSSLTSAVPDIEASELTQIQNGEIYERVIELASNPSETYPEKQARLDAEHAVVTASVASYLQTVLQYWGYQRDIP